MVDSAMVPMSTNDVSGAPSWRNLASRPIDSTPTTGQNSSSKKKKMLREAISRLRSANAHTATSSARQRSARQPSARQLNEDLLQLRLAHPNVANDHALGVERLQQRGQALVGVVDDALDSPVPLRVPQHARDV